MSEDTSSPDWSAFRSTAKQFTLDELSIFSRAGVDPLTVQVAQHLCQPIQLASQGQRNLTKAFSNLPVPMHRNLGMGYDTNHIVYTIMEADEGFTFLGVCGVLAEYFAEDSVVDIFESMINSAKVPLEISPSRRQWRKLVEVCSGVLCTSGFGILVDEFTTAAKDHTEGLEPTCPSFIADSFLRMSSITKANGNTVEINGGSDAGWLAAVGSWLFDLNVVLRTKDGVDVESRHKSGGNQKPQWVVVCQKPDQAAGLACYVTNKSTGGRLTWQTLLRSSFGRSFLDLEPNSLSKAVGCASRMAVAAIEAKHGDVKLYFLSQSYDGGSQGSGLISTITAWFPELIYLRPRMIRWLKLTMEEAWHEFSAALKDVESKCPCDRCTPGNAKDDAIFCQLSLVDTIISLGFSISRMTVTPELYPKRSGIVAYYARQQVESEKWKARRAEAPSAEAVLQRFSSTLPTSDTMLKAAFIIFTGSVADDISAECLGLTARGLGVFHTDYHVLKSAPSTLIGVKVTIGTLGYHGRIYKQALHDEGVSGLKHADAEEMVRLKPDEVSTIVKGIGDDLFWGLIRRGTGEDKKAVEEGYRLLELSESS